MRTTKQKEAKWMTGPRSVQLVSMIVGLSMSIYWKERTDFYSTMWFKDKDLEMEKSVSLIQVLEIFSVQIENVSQIKTSFPSFIIF